MTHENLDCMRLTAAECSKGISSGPIYAKVLHLVDSLKISGKVIDYGAGIGNLSKRLCAKDDFSQVTAVDIAQFPGALQHPKLQWLYCDLNTSIPVSNESYDAVISCEVIEHLENPRSLAREWFRILKPGGHLVLSTPNNESWRSIISLIVRGHFAEFTGTSYPAHITALLRTDLQRVLSEAGFQHIAFSFTDHGAIPALTNYTWQAVSAGFLKGLRYSDNFFCTANKP